MKYKLSKYGFSLLDAINSSRLIDIVSPKDQYYQINQLDQVSISGEMAISETVKGKTVIVIGAFRCPRCYRWQKESVKSERSVESGFSYKSVTVSDI